MLTLALPASGAVGPMAIPVPTQATTYPVSLYAPRTPKYNTVNTVSMPVRTLYAAECADYVANPSKLTTAVSQYNFMALATSMDNERFQLPTPTYKAVCTSTSNTIVATFAINTLPSATYTIVGYGAATAVNTDGTPIVRNDFNGTVYDAFVASTRITTSAPFVYTNRIRVAAQSAPIARTTASSPIGSG